MEFQPHSLKQDAALFSNKRFTVVGTGIQWGKTEVGSVWILDKIYTFTHPKDRFIITAPTYKVMDQATLPTFMEKVEPLKIGKYRKADHEFVLKWGSRVLFRTGHIPDSVVGIRRTRAIWADEAGLYSLYFWENLQGRAAPWQAPIILTTSPYSLNWLFKDLIRPAQEGLRDDVLLIQAASNENPYFPQEEFESRKKTMDPRRFQMMFGGMFERPEGMVYKCFDIHSNTCHDADVPYGRLIYYAGVDWGYTEALAVCVLGVDPETGKRYVIDEHKQSGMSLTNIKDLLRGLNLQYSIDLFACGPERPEMIDEMCKHGISAIKAFNDVRMGLDIVYELMAKRDLMFVKGRTRHHLDELESYHYPEHIETRPDKKVIDTLPVQVDDHAMDAMRYAVATTINLSKVRPPRQSDTEAMRQFGKTNYQRIKELMKKGNNYSGL